jgi:hypothetical protein
MFQKQIRFGIPSRKNCPVQQQIRFGIPSSYITVQFTVLNAIQFVHLLTVILGQAHLTGSRGDGRIADMPILDAFLYIRDR